MKMDPKPFVFTANVGKTCKSLESENGWCQKTCVFSANLRATAHADGRMDVPMDGRTIKGFRAQLPGKPLRMRIMFLGTKSFATKDQGKGPSK